ncbi:hypothetical protein HYR54_00750 [Candidatus Acetothermia bacterium]|nr:hypothetical protein [Candidatus Acetothermia bacterium]MBI3461053.1 hypothetical protein [Candidatus Acetothermia bacterium]
MKAPMKKIQKIVYEYGVEISGDEMPAHNKMLNVVIMINLDLEPAAFRAQPTGSLKTVFINVLLMPNVGHII